MPHRSRGERSPPDRSPDDGHRGSRLLLLGKQSQLRDVRFWRVDHPEQVPSLATPIAPRGGDDVAGRLDRVRLEHARLDAVERREDTDERLPDQVVGRVGIPHAGPDDAYSRAGTSVVT